MSIQWTLVATVLYSEIAVVLLLVLPLISPRRWQRIFKSRFLQALSKQAQWYFAIIFVILLVFMVDAIREIRKYSNEQHDKVHPHLEVDLQTHMKLFRAQRNFYISGFSLFLSLVIGRLVILISTQATLLAENEAALKQAKSATSIASNLLAQTSGGGEAAQNSYNEAHQKEITKLNDELDELKKHLEKEIKDKEAVITQAKNLQKEYDRLTEEYSKLQCVVDGESNKKEE